MTTMTKEQLEAIREQHVKDQQHHMDRYATPRFWTHEAAHVARGKLLDEVDRLQSDLQFVERWANHHARKPHVSAESALSIIQHYPPITDITKSYADGVIPATPDPWERLTAENEGLKAALLRPLTEEQIVACLVDAGCLGTVHMSYDAGPYEITRSSLRADAFVRAIEKARAAREQKP